MRAVRLVVCAALCCASVLGGGERRAFAQAAATTTEVPRTNADPSAQASGAASSPAQSESAAEPPALPPRRTLWDFVKVLPILFYTPETSAGFGAGLLFQYDLPGAERARRPSSITLGSVYTLNHQILGQFTPELRLKHDDFVLKLDVVGARYPNRFYGIGNDTRASVYDTYTDCYLRGELDARMRPFAQDSIWRPLFLGLNYAAAWSNMRDPAAGSTLHKSLFASLHDRGQHDVLAVGMGPSAAWDSRDSLNWPQRGAFMEVKSTFFSPAFGGNLRYQRLSMDLRQYYTPWLDHVLAMRFVAQAVWGQVPFQRLPQLGGASLFRGWYGGQLRERLLLAAEAEYRVPISRRWAVVGFGSIGRVASNVRHFDLSELHFVGGGGLRVSVDKRDRVNIRLDLAYGDAFYPYLQFREAF